MVTPQSHTRPSTTSMAASARRTHELPLYQPLIHPLSPAALRAVQNLKGTHDLAQLNERLATATQVLSNSAAEISDRYQHQIAQLERAKVKTIGKDEETKGLADKEKRLEGLREEVDDMTGRMEERIRAIIDAKASVEVKQKLLDGIGERLERGGSLHTQSTLGASQSQFRRARRRAMVGDGSDDDEYGGDEHEAHDAVDGVVSAWKRKIGDEERSYELLSMRAK